MQWRVAPLSYRMSPLQDVTVESVYDGEEFEVTCLHALGTITDGKCGRGHTAGNL